ncbi:hypothetical protein A0J61_01604 [Choanephora cucurbitarum]|uniref:Uncharacterized protein n=1 Tax=Choanephora cucurbitarum TaxID=101091 RepID=A0A1C7NNA6_9FUNG|nr:hypothetical protein A0J61_01604 [Choanephora cucurbitarum]
MSDINKIDLNRQLQEAKVLNAELSHLKPSSRLYERQVPSSNIFFLAQDNEAVRTTGLEHQKRLEQQLKR